MSKGPREKRSIKLDIRTYSVFSILLMLLIVINVFDIYILRRQYRLKINKATMQVFEVTIHLM